jgi:hypothetical protein
VTKPLLHRLGSERTDDLRYEIVGYEHLAVEPEYCGSSKPQYWTVRDIRFNAGLDRWNRWQVLVVPRLEVARSWVRAGGPALWDPERRKTDRNWRPIPEGWQAGEAGSEVPRRTNRGVHDAGGPDRRRDPDDRHPAHREFRPSGTTGKKYAVCPGYVTSDDGQRHFIGFGALTWLYGVRPSECLHVDPEAQGEKLPSYVEELIWLHPQPSLRHYAAIREELARGEDAFKLEDPCT